MVGCRIAYKWNVLFPKPSHIVPWMKQTQKISHFRSTLLFNWGQQDPAFQKPGSSDPNSINRKDTTWKCRNVAPSFPRGECGYPRKPQFNRIPSFHLFIPQTSVKPLSKIRQWHSKQETEGFPTHTPSLRLAQERSYHMEQRAQILPPGS